MHKLPEPAPRRWRVPVFLLLGTALLVGSFTVAALALPSRADDGAPPQSNADQPDLIGRRTVAAGMVDTREGVTTVLPLQPGQVKEVYAKEQQDYDKGAKLYLMDDQHAQFGIACADSQLGQPLVHDGDQPVVLAKYIGLAQANVAAGELTGNVDPRVVGIGQ